MSTVAEINLVLAAILPYEVFSLRLGCKAMDMFELSSFCVLRPLLKSVLGDREYYAHGVSRQLAYDHDRVQRLAYKRIHRRLKAGHPGSCPGH